MAPNKTQVVLYFILGMFFQRISFAQQVPSAQENMSCLVTFGINGDHSWGDDDFSQTVFFSIPKSQTTPFYIRIFDPETFGELDEIKEGWDTKIKYSIYGGKDAYYDKDARGVNPIGNYKSGILMDSKIFGSDAATDGKWISMGPFNPQQGEFVNDFDSYVFKVVIDGLKGNDGNGYKLFLSVRNTENIAVEGANAFAYEYSVRLQSVVNSIAHVYPFADNLITGFKIRSFDFDNDGQVKLYSSVKNGHPVAISDNNEWSMASEAIVDGEKNKCLDLQIVKKGDYTNDLVLYITNEYDVPVPFFAAPLGGVPRYNYKVKVSKTPKDK
ncbi:hypothetical protein CNR22_08905 [Sphingobacteriaceae bacterium]|nr:hypothetical protein CNR22_08905 [Sphingobacteriaceae bacterium]